MRIVMDNLPRLQVHLNYLAFAAFSGQRREAKMAEDRGPLGYIQILAEDLSKIMPGEHADELRSELNRVVALARASGTEAMLDGRIQRLAQRFN
jgi:hypothetical protein